MENKIIKKDLGSSPSTPILSLRYSIPWVNNTKYLIEMEKVTGISAHWIIWHIYHIDMWESTIKSIEYIDGMFR